MNDSGRKQYDDEIDLFEIVEIIWQGKWIIVASVFIVLAAAYAYLINKVTKALPPTNNIPCICGKSFANTLSRSA